MKIEAKWKIQREFMQKMMRKRRIRVGKKWRRNNEVAHPDFHGFVGGKQQFRIRNHEVSHP